MNTHNRSESITPTFIISCERSGSTLLRYIVDTHPDIATPGEIHLGQLCQDLYRTVSRTSALVAPAADEAQRHQFTITEVRRIVSEIMDGYARAKGKRQWCEKTTMNLDYLDTLYEVFPDAHYICLYRNAMDVAHSCIEAGRLGFLPEHVPYVHRHPRNLVAAMVERWVEKTGELLAFERRHAGQCFRMQYEQLVADPAEALAPMFEFLGVAWDAGIPDKVFVAKHDQGDGDSKVRFASKIYQSSIGKGSTLNRSALPDQLLNELNAMLAELDYPIVGPDWDTSPSPYLDMRPKQREATPGLSEIFTHYLPQRLSQINGGQPQPIVYKIVATGEGGGVWRIDLGRPDSPVAAGEGDAHCTLTMSAGDLLTLIGGNLNAAEAWLQGRLHIAGDVTQAEQLGRILFAGPQESPAEAVEAVEALA